MVRARIYHTAAEKAAANRAKSKRHYDKVKDDINLQRRKQYRRKTKASKRAGNSAETSGPEARGERMRSVPDKRPSRSELEHNRCPEVLAVSEVSILPNATTVEPSPNPATEEISAPKKIRYSRSELLATAKKNAGNIQTEFDKSTNKDLRAFANDICIQYLADPNRTDEVVDVQVRTFSEMRGSLNIYRDQILQLAGFSAWNRLGQLDWDLRTLVIWLEEILCVIISDGRDGVKNMHLNTMFLFQQLVDNR